jgi:lambda family phage portal protein
MRQLVSMARPSREAPRRAIDLFSPAVPSPRQVRAKYDAAQTNEENRRHWANADGLSADAAASADVRRVLRNRARYEVANNSYARGIVLTLANDTIGTGPRLQMLSADRDANNLIEREFMRWARAVNLAGVLRTMRMARAESGEVFSILHTNPVVDSPVQLDLRLVEADQVATPHVMQRDDRLVDGIVFDTAGNPAEYHVLRVHPGDTGSWAPSLGAFDPVPAEQVIHLFRSERPGQSRGIPELTPALPLFALLRRYRLAVLTAAETAANFALPIYTDVPAGGEADPLEPMDVFEMERGLGMVLPQGWKPAQIKAEHPSTNHVEFIESVLAEIARCLNMPFNVAAGDSSGYNYASGRLDHQTYYKAIRVDQAHIAQIVLDRILEAWIDEAVLIEGYLPQWMRQRNRQHLDHQWFWDGFEHVDPAKEANAQATRLSSHTTTLAIEFAKQGRDWETELRQRAREKALMKELGLDEPVSGSAGAPGAAPGAPTPVTDRDDDDEVAVKEAA